MKKHNSTNGQDLGGQQASAEELVKLQQELDQLRADFERANDQLKRAVADYHNLEKRIAEGRSELGRWATSELIAKVLPVVDHLEKALAGANEQERESGWLKGVEIAVKQLQQVLKEEGLDEIAIDPVSEHGTGGTRFDPALHEAVDTREGEDNHILEVVEKGYNLNGKVLRPAKVVVGRKA